MNPQAGDTRIADCTWCPRTNVVQTYRRYDPPLSGGYWDTGSCPCGEIVYSRDGRRDPTLRGLEVYGRKKIKQVDMTGKQQQYRDGKRRA